MRLKNTKKSKTSRVAFRCTENEENKMQQKANIYTEGNISEYIIFAALNFVPSKSDFEQEENKGPPKKRKASKNKN